MDRLNKGHYFYINMSSKDRNATMLPFGITVAFLYGCFFTAPFLFQKIVIYDNMK